MARLVTITVLVDDDDAHRIDACLEDMLAVAQAPVDPDGNTNSWLVDFSVGHSYPVNHQLDAEIKSNGYQGAGLEDWVIFSPSELQKDGEAGFWSNEYGWTTFDLATRFSPHTGSIQFIGVNDARWIRHRQWLAAATNLGLKTYLLAQSPA